MHRLVLVAAIASACGNPAPGPSSTGAAAPEAHSNGSLSEAGGTSSTTTPSDAGTTAAPLDAGSAARACKADANHCCQADLRIVRVGCDPDDGHGNDRGPGGFCQPTGCKCLPGDTRIATPNGDRLVAHLVIGDRVWTADRHGSRVAAPVVAVSSIPFEGEHPVAEIRLDDGRVFEASPGHPLVDGTLVGALQVGARVDGATVRAIRARAIRGRTWDLLPAGDTGTYWADGVRLGSTLHARD